MSTTTNLPPEAPGDATGRPRVPAVAIATNALLIGALVLVSSERGATAQGQPERQAGQYALVGGERQTSDGNVVYIVDAVNRELIAVDWNRSRFGLDSIGYRDLDADQTATPGR